MTAQESANPLLLSVDAPVSVDRFSGSLSARISFDLPEGRNGLSPVLGLSYAGARRRGPFGTGWSLNGLPAVGVDGDDGVPGYGTEDGYSTTLGGRLVRWRDADGNLQMTEAGGFQIMRFRAETDDARLRFERWTEIATGRVHWQSRDTTNTVTIYGLSADGMSRIADPRDPGRTYQWLPELIVGPMGDAIHIAYVAEDHQGTGAFPADTGRSGPEPLRYPKRISWLNRQPADPADPMAFDASAARWAFSVVFDYGDHEPDSPQLLPDRAWPARPDPYSMGTAGFEIRAWRLCRRLLLFHDFPVLGPDPVLAASYAFDYLEAPEGSRLGSLTRRGHRTDSERSVPPLTLEYVTPDLGESFEPVPQTLASAAPAGLAESRSRLVDLYGEGLPGLLYDTPSGWSFRRSLGGGDFTPDRLVNARPAHMLAAAALGDFDADGNIEAVVLSGAGAGAYSFDRRTDQWGPFRAFPNAPRISGGGRVQRLDLTGDGRADLVHSNGAELTWHGSRGADGYAAEARRVTHESAVLDGPAGTAPLSADPSTHYLFADMTGDGMPDQVLIRPGLVAYWPNLGHGRFGRPRIIENAPNLGGQGRFSLIRVLLADLDGSGTSDLIWIGEGEIRIWTNASGNQFVSPRTLSGLPTIDAGGVLEVLDILGDGSRYLVWSTRAAAGESLQMLRLSGSTTSGLLAAVDNGMGYRDEIVWGHSLLHYRRDRDGTRPWITRLPAHVAVVDRLVRRDLVTGLERVAEFRYRNGAFNSRRRHFAGFGEVDAIEAQHILEPEAPEAATAPSLTRSFYDVGFDLSVAGRFWEGDPDAVRPPVFSLNTTASGPVDGETFDQARSRLAGREIRTEVYALGPDGPEPVPLSVTNAGYQVDVLQAPHGDGRPGRPHLSDRAAFAMIEVESVRALHEGVADDPRVNHSMVLELDSFGAVSLAADLVYPRRPHVGADDPQQEVLHAALKRLTVRHDDSETLYALNQPIEIEEFSIDAAELPERGWFVRTEMSAVAGLALAAPLAHDRPLTPGRARRTGWTRHRYWNGDGTAELPLGQTEQPLRLHHAENAVASDAFMTAMHGAGIEGRLPALGYVSADGHWWQTDDPILYFGPSGFWRPAGTRLRDDRETTIEYDEAAYFVTAGADANGAVTQSEHDYLALAVARREGPTGAWEQSLFDPLGIAVLTATGGHVPATGGGQAPQGFDPLAPDAAGPAMADAITDPLAALGGAAAAVAYDLEAWQRDGTPVALVQIAANDMTHDGAGGTQTSGNVTLSIIYHGGDGAEVTRKQLVDPGPAITREQDGSVTLDDTGAPALQPAATRYAASGYVLENAKGEALRQFQPYFTPSPDYEGDEVLQALGPPRTVFHDAAGRNIWTLFEDGTGARTEYGAWSRRHFDANDTSATSAWRVPRQILPASDPERHALDGALAHADTPLEEILDGVGRTVLAREANGLGGIREIRTLVPRDGLTISTVDARGLIATVLHHDMAGRVVRETSVDSGERNLLHDAASNVVERRLPNGAVETTTFDSLNRVTTIDVVHGGPVRRIARFDYADDPTDPAVIDANLYGHPIEIGDEAGLTRLVAVSPSGLALRSEVQFFADAAAPVDWAAPAALDPEVFVTTLQHDALNRSVREGRPDGSILSARYSLDGGLAGLSVETEDGQVPETTIFTEATQTIDGQRQSVRFGNGVMVEHSHDPLSRRLRRVIARREPAAGRPELLQDLRYAYDPVGNVTSVRDLAHDAEGDSAFFTPGAGVSAERRYTYDAFYQLRSATGRAHAALTGGHQRPTTVPLSDPSGLERFTQTFVYDLAGNMTRRRHSGVVANWTVDFWVDPASNRSRPENGPGGVPAHDPAGDFAAGGEMIRMDHLAALDWRHDQRLARVVVIDRSASGQPDDDELYVYDSSGARVRKITRRLLGSGAVERREVIEIGGARFERLFRDDVAILDRRTIRFSDSVGEVAEMHRWTLDSSARETNDISAVRFRYTLNDHLSSAAVRLDQDARLISYEEYLPFGGCAFIAGDDARETALKTHSFIARERDAATGLHSVSRRYYATWLCRWISPDPAGDVDGSNRFLYTRNNPTTHVDHSGLRTAPPTGKARNVPIHGSPPEEWQRHVDEAFARLPEERRRELLELKAQGNFTWAIIHDDDDRVVFGTLAEIAEIKEKRNKEGQKFKDYNAPSAKEVDDTDDTALGTIDGSTEGDSATAPGGGEEAGSDDDAAPGAGPAPLDAGTDDKPSQPSDGGSGGSGEGDGDDDGDDTPGIVDGASDGRRRDAGSDGSGTGGGGTSDDPTARGRSNEGTGYGGGTGDPLETGLGDPGGAGDGSGGNGTGPGRPGGLPGGVEGGKPGGKGTTPGANGTNKVPGGQGQGGDGVPGGVPGGGPGGAAGGAEGGIPGGSLNGDPAGGPSPEGTDPYSGAGGTRSAPTDGPPPQRGGTAPNGSAEGSAQGSQQDRQGDQQTGGGNSPEPATAMDHIVRVAGYWHLEFGSDGNGKSGGVPGGSGSINFGAWGQSLFVALTVADIALTVITLGGIAGIKAGLRAAATAAKSIGQRALTRVGALFTRQFWQSAGNAAVRAGLNWNPFRGRLLREFWDAKSIARAVSTGNVTVKNLFGKVVGKTRTAVDWLGFRNTSGTRIWASTGNVSHNHVKSVVQRLDNMNGDGVITVLTGRHGDVGGTDALMKAEKFLVEDLVGLPSSARIDIHDVTRLTDDQLAGLLEHSDEVVLAWCHSESSRRIQRALGLNFGTGVF